MIKQMISVMTAAICLAACGNNSSDEVGEFSNDWLGNEIKVEAFDDPKVAGVTCHMSHFDRGVFDRLQKGNWFEDPSNASIACVQSGPIVLGDIKRGKGGEEVFRQRQSLMFKTVAVRRIYDAEKNALIYVVYSRKPIDGSSKMSLTSISLYNNLAGDTLPSDEALGSE